MIKNNLYYILFLASCLACTATAQNKVQLMDGDSVYSIPFFLKHGKTLLMSNSSGVLLLNDSAIKSYNNTKWTLDFENDLDYTIYSNKLYLNKNPISNDRFLSFSDLSLDSLFSKKANTYYLMPKQNKVDKY